MMKSAVSINLLYSGSITLFAQQLTVMTVRTWISSLCPVILCFLTGKEPANPQVLQLQREVQDIEMEIEAQKMKIQNTANPTLRVIIIL